MPHRAVSLGAGERVHFVCGIKPAVVRLWVQARRARDIRFGGNQRRVLSRFGPQLARGAVSAGASRLGSLVFARPRFADTALLQNGWPDISWTRAYDAERVGAAPMAPNEVLKRRGTLMSHRLSYYLERLAMVGIDGK